MTRDQIDVVWQQAMHDAIAEGEQMTRYRFAEMISAIQRQAEPTGKKSLQVESVVAENATTQQQIEQTPPSDYRRGYWDGFNIGKREGRIEAEDALAQQAEPEPVAWMCPEDLERETAFNWRPGHCENCGKQRIPLYTALVQDQDPELSAALGWPGGISDPVLDRKTLLQQVARLVERAPGIGEEE